MEIIVTGKGIQITDAIRDYASDKAGKLPRYYDRVTLIEVIADKPNDREHSIEILVHVEHHDPMVARTQGADLYACIDEGIQKMERQLTDHKEKLRNRKHNTR